MKDISEEYTVLGNLSNRISEILHMPTPKRKLQPILKPIKSYRRPKAAFKKRTPVAVDGAFVAKQTTETLQLNQMLSFAAVPKAESDHSLTGSSLPPLPKISPIKSSLHSASTSKLSFQQSKVSIETLVVSHCSESKSELSIKEKVSPSNCFELRSDKKGQEIEVGVVKRIDHIVLPTASLDTLSSDKSLGDKTKKVVFPCLQIPRSIDETKEVKENERRHFSDSKHRKPKFRKRIMTLLDLVSKRDRSMKVKSNAVIPIFEASPWKGKKSKYPNTSFMKSRQYQSVDNRDMTKSQKKDSNSDLTFEDFDDLQFNLNNENVTPARLELPISRQTKGNPGFWKSSQRLSERQRFNFQRRNDSGGF